MLGDIRNLANVGISFSTTVLGFLIAGFTIFATASKPRMLALMAEIVEPKSKLSYLKNAFFAFFRTFIYYLWFAFFCIAVLVLGTPMGFLARLGLLLPAKANFVYAETLARSGLFLASWGLVLMCFELKSFIFNIYAAVMAMVRFVVQYGDDDSA